MQLLISILFIPLLILNATHLEAAAPLELKIIERGTSSGLIKKDLHFLVISDPANFATTYRQIRSMRFPPTAPPEIDFDKHRILIALMGQQMTSGYAINFHLSVGQKGRIIEVKVQLEKPPPDAIVLEMLTAPYVIAVMPRGTYEAVRFLSDEGAALETINITH